MNDMSQVIIPKSDQINADDLIAGPRTFRIEGVEVRPGTEQPVNIRLAGEDRVWRPCKSMSRVLVAAWGPDANAYNGRSITLYRDPKVKWGGMEIGGIRVSHMSHIDREMLLQLTATKGKRAPHIVKPLEVRSEAKSDGPTTWANGYIANINRAETAEALATFVESRAKKLAELQASRPELHAECVAAIDARRATFAGDQWADDEIDEGKPDEDRGEAFNDTPEETARAEEIIAQTEGSPAYLAAVRDLRSKLAAAQTVKAVDGIDRDWANTLRGVVEDADEGLMRSVEKDIKSRRNELRTQTEG